MLGKLWPTGIESSNYRQDKRSTSKVDFYLLCPPRVLGYATQHKSWGQFKVENTTDVPDNLPKTFEKKLELDKKEKDMIRALVENHERTKSGKAQVTDVIEGKGRNLAILLHGKVH